MLLTTRHQNISTRFYSAVINIGLHNVFQRFTFSFSYGFGLYRTHSYWQFNCQNVDIVIFIIFLFSHFCPPHSRKACTSSMSHVEENTGWTYMNLCIKARPLFFSLPFRKTMFTSIREVLFLSLNSLTTVTDRICLNVFLLWMTGTVLCNSCLQYNVACNLLVN